MSETKIKELEEHAKLSRALTLEMLAAIGSGHLGGAMSIVEILTLLYFDRMNIDPQSPHWPDRDRFILSKGHAGPALYATLARKGYFPEKECLTLNQPGTNLPSHCDMLRTTGIDMTAGSLGQGLSAAIGMALAAKIDGKGYRVYCVIGDGEAQEGQIWEAMMYASQKKLNNLVAFIDYNKLQIDGAVDEINSIAPLADKCRAFGFHTATVDGHDFAAMSAALDEAEKCGGPAMIILDTVKAKGACFAEGKVTSHNMPVTQNNLMEALTALGVKEGA